VPVESVALSATDFLAPAVNALTAISFTKASPLPKVRQLTGRSATWTLERSVSPDYASRRSL
jgi:hypothetical protein